MERRDKGTDSEKRGDGVKDYRGVTSRYAYIVYMRQ